MRLPSSSLKRYFAVPSSAETCFLTISCTVNPEENVQNALWFAAEHDFDIVNLAGRIPAKLASCVDSNGFIQIMPGMFDNDFDGFFIAAFVRR